MKKIIGIILVLMVSVVSTSASAQLINYNRKYKITEFKGSVVRVDDQDSQFIIRNNETGEELTLKARPDQLEQLSANQVVALQYSKTSNYLHKIDAIEQPAQTTRSSYSSY